MWRLLARWYARRWWASGDGRSVDSKYFNPQSLQVARPAADFFHFIENEGSAARAPTSPEPSLAFCPRETSVFPLRFPCDLPATASMSVTQSLSSIKADKRDLLPRPYLCFLVVGRKNTLEHYQDVAPLCPSDPLGRMQFWRPRRGRRAVLTPGGGE